MSKRYPATGSTPPLIAREAPGIPWSVSTGDLPDINVWLALAVQEHPHHAAARAYWTDVQAEGASLWFCRVTMLGLVRLLCQPKVVGEGALAPAAAWAAYQRFRAVTGVGLLSEPEGSDLQLHALVAQSPLPARLWTDAYLAALSRAAGLRLVTFDRDFHRFALERVLVLNDGGNKETP
jgi:toxin-antitoxin system PIN domain toxin